MLVQKRLLEDLMFDISRDRVLDLRATPMERFSDDLGLAINESERPQVDLQARKRVWV